MGEKTENGDRVLVFVWMPVRVSEWTGGQRGADHSLWSVWLRRVLLLIFEAVPSEIWSWPKIKSTAWQHENKAGSKQTAGHITNSTSSNDHLVEIGLFTKVNLSNYCVINDKHTWALDCLAFQFNFSQVEECSSWYQTQTKSEGAAGVEECCRCMLQKRKLGRIVLNQIRKWDVFSHLIKIINGVGIDAAFEGEWPKNVGRKRRGEGVVGRN